MPFTFTDLSLKAIERPTINLNEILPGRRVAALVEWRGAMICFHTIDSKFHYFMIKQQTQTSSTKMIEPKIEFKTQSSRSRLV